MPFFRALRNFVALLVVLVVVYFFAVAVYVLVQSHEDERGKVDAIVVLGAAQYNGVPSPVLKARLDHAADLYEEGVAPTIVVTGGRAAGDEFSEASASAAYLGELGIADDKILREVDGTNTWNSLEAAALFMKDRGIQSIVLVSDPFHDARARLMAKDLGLKANVSPTQTSPIKGTTAAPYYAKEIVSVAVGEPLGWSSAVRLEKVLGRNGIS